LLRRGIESHRAGNLEEAERHYRAVLSIDGDHGLGLVHLALVAQDGRNFNTAEGLLKRATELHPKLAEAHFHLGNLYFVQRRLADAEAYYRAAIKLSPTYIEAYNNLGYSLGQLGRVEDAARCFRDALAIDPSHVGVLINYGNLLREQGMPEEALPYLATAAAVLPTSASGQNNLGNAYKDLGQLDEAIATYRRALLLAPKSAEVHSNLGIVLQKIGDIQSATASFRRALDLRPTSSNAYRNLLSALLFDPDATPAVIFAEHQRFGKTFAQPPYKPAFTNSPDPDRPLRLGFVSFDFHDHPVARNLMPLLGNFDRSAFKIFLYTANAVEDAVTTEIRNMADGWHTIVNDSDEAAADRIQSDAIDVLFLLAGRFDRNRPLIATYRPAPIQVSFHDPATSGLDTIDYLVSDSYLTPRRRDEQFTERVLCLPHFYVHPPLVSAPPVEKSPFRENGYITFGSCNKPSKLNDTVLRIWADLLNRVPNSRLLLKYRNQFTSPAVQARVSRIFAAAGVDPGRIRMFGELESFSRHLRTYNAIDIALDSFPFSGSTTTFEALWMGVPVVTIAGRGMAARWTASMLHALKMDELVSATPAGYVELASGLAADRPKLEQIRASLRQRVETSPLCDGVGRAREFGRLTRVIWRRWCARQIRASSNRA
jgi:protein O-GlcNAc transferase